MLGELHRCFLKEVNPVAQNEDFGTVTDADRIKGAIDLLEHGAHSEVDKDTAIRAALRLMKQVVHG